MKPEILHLAKLLVKHHPEYHSLKQAENGLLWYAIHNGVIHVTNENGEALYMFRQIDHIEQRNDHHYICPDGSILWIDFWFQNDIPAAMDAALLAIERFKSKCTHIAFYRTRDCRMHYRMWPARSVLRYLKNLLSKYGRLKSSSNT